VLYKVETVCFNTYLLDWKRNSWTSSTKLHTRWQHPSEWINVWFAV